MTAPILAALAAHPMIQLKFPTVGRAPISIYRPLAIAGLLAVGLAGCRVPSRPQVGGAEAEAAQLVRESALSVAHDWSFSGRVALSRDGKGGSGRIEWLQSGDDFRIVLSAPVGGPSWKIEQKAGNVRVEGIDGGPREGSDARALLQDATGWDIPLADLGYWIRGARAPGPAAIAYDGNGRPLRIQQGGWNIEYRGWNGGALARPSKLFASQGDASVRLVVDQWGQP